MWRETIRPLTERVSGFDAVHSHAAAEPHSTLPLRCPLFEPLRNISQLVHDRAIELKLA